MKTVPLNTEHLEKRLKPQLAYLQAHTKPPTASHHNEHIAQTKIFADSSISSDIDLVKVNIKFCNVSKRKKNTSTSTTPFFTITLSQPPAAAKKGMQEKTGSTWPKGDQVKAIPRSDSACPPGCPPGLHHDFKLSVS